MEKPAGSRSSKARMKTVRMGEIVVETDNQPVKTILGSCIGLALFDKDNEVGGLAHIVLPDSNGHEGPLGKFVDTAIPELIRVIEESKGLKRKLSAKMAGGANMLNGSAGSTVGERNYESTKQFLKELGIPLLASHCGDDFGRRMTFYPGTGRVCIDIVGCETIEI